MVAGLLVKMLCPEESKREISIFLAALFSETNCTAKASKRYEEE
jgi:hypothetical protein